jgi:hypothetical protein
MILVKAGQHHEIIKDFWWKDEKEKNTSDSF